MASTETERFRRNIHLRDSSVPINHMISSSREIGEKLKENQSDFVPVQCLRILGGTLRHK